MYFEREYRDPGYGLLTVTDVQVSPDLRIAKIYVSILGTSEVKARAMALLEDQRGAIRSFIGSHIRLKFTPAVHFYVDDTLERVQRIESLIKEIHKNDNPDRS